MSPELVETPDPGGAAPRLTEAQIELLGRHGERRPTEVGDVLYREGDESFRAGSVKRVASAVGEGAMAVQLVHRHLARI